MTALSLHTGVPVVAAMGRGGGGRPRPVPEQANCPLGCWQVAGTGTSSGVSASKRGHLATAFVRGVGAPFLSSRGRKMEAVTGSYPRQTESAATRGHQLCGVPAMGEVPRIPEPSQEPEEPRKFLSGGD